MENLSLLPILKQTKNKNQRKQQGIYLIIKVIQVGISALQLHHLDFGDPILFPLQHEIGIRVLSEMILMTAPVIASISCTIKIPMLTEELMCHIHSKWTC